ncbi:hypothetical protein XNC3_430005 [Xenorhabdus nematophila F1]|nr:hypothetical protein XNC3_430005 [Xenorhabdus nematophila F1]
MSEDCCHIDNVGFCRRCCISMDMSGALLTRRKLLFTLLTLERIIDLLKLTGFTFLYISCWHVHLVSCDMNFPKLW